MSYWTIWATGPQVERNGHGRGSIPYIVPNWIMKKAAGKKNSFHRNYDVCLMPTVTVTTKLIFMLSFGSRLGPDKQIQSNRSHRDDNSRHRRRIRPSRLGERRSKYRMEMEKGTRSERERDGGIQYLFSHAMNEYGRAHERHVRVCKLCNYVIVCLWLFGLDVWRRLFIRRSESREERVRRIDRSDLNESE